MRAATSVISGQGASAGAIKGEKGKDDCGDQQQEGQRGGECGFGFVGEPYEMAQFRPAGQGGPLCECIEAAREGIPSGPVGGLTSSDDQRKQVSLRRRRRSKARLPDKGRGSGRDQQRQRAVDQVRPIQGISG